MNKKYKKIILIHGWGFNSSIWNNVIENSIYGSQMHPLNIYAEARESGTNINSITNSIANKHPDLDCIVGWSMGCYFANALSKISKKLPIVYVSFLPSFDNFSELGCGFTKKEVENLYDDLNKFMEILDLNLQSLNSDYEAKRYKSSTLELPKLVVARKNLFYDWLSSKNKLGGQNKIPRLSNSRQFIEELISMN